MTLIYNKKIEKKYSWKEFLKHESWCFNNDVIIYCKPIDYYYCIIVIEDKGKLTVLDEKYKLRNLKSKDKNWSEEIRKLMTKYYLKYNKDESN